MEKYDWEVWCAIFILVKCSFVNGLAMWTVEKITILFRLFGFCRFMIVLNVVYKNLRDKYRKYLLIIFKIIKSLQLDFQ